VLWVHTGSQQIRVARDHGDGRPELEDIDVTDGHYGVVVVDLTDVARLGLDERSLAPTVGMSMTDRHVQGGTRTGNQCGSRQQGARLGGCVVPTAAWAGRTMASVLPARGE
jgi:hypothetical protein